MTHVIKPRVAESSTSTGTGAMALTAALTAHKRFSAVCSVADTTEYLIVAVDTQWFPTGEWEEGSGTYSATNTLTRTTPTNGSAATPVNFSAGSKVVFITPLASRVGGIPRSTAMVKGDGAGHGGGDRWYDYTSPSSTETMTNKTMEAMMVTNGYTEETEVANTGTACTHPSCRWDTKETHDDRQRDLHLPDPYRR